MARPWTTYLYAHARDGMFLPLLLQSRIDNGSAMLGMLVQVYTSDDQLFLYEITRVLRHQSELYERARTSSWCCRPRRVPGRASPATRASC